MPHKFPEVEEYSRPTPRTVLIVEDEPIARSSIQRYLEFRGHKVMAVASKVDALQRAEQASPDVVICDWMLEGGDDGVEIAHRLQKRHNAVVVLMTARPIKDIKVVARSIGLQVRAFRRKPVSLGNLLALVESIAVDS